MMNKLAVLLLALSFVAVACAGDNDTEDSATFIVEGTEAVMEGVIGSDTPDAVRDLLADYPDVRTIVMTNVPGSADDDANLEAARLLREAGLRTHLESDGEVASGGVDFFLAGAERTFDAGAKFGVHSWATGDGTEGTDLAEDDPEHNKYLDFYDEMGVDPDFYWFTLQAAPAADIYFMTAAELDDFGFSTAG